MITLIFSLILFLIIFLLAIAFCYLLISIHKQTKIISNTYLKDLNNNKEEFIINQKRSSVNNNSNTFIGVLIGIGLVFYFLKPNITNNWNFVGIILIFEILTISFLFYQYKLESNNYYNSDKLNLLSQKLNKQLTLFKLIIVLFVDLIIIFQFIQ